MLRFRGCQHFRQRLLLSTLSGKAIRIDDIRVNDQSPGLHDYEASLLRLLEKLTNGCLVEINETGRAHVTHSNEAVPSISPPCAGMPWGCHVGINLTAAVDTTHSQQQGQQQTPVGKIVCSQLCVVSCVYADCRKVPDVYHCSSWPPMVVS